MKKITLLTSFFVLTACTTAVQKDMVATGGSKADGTVVMSYEYSFTEKPEVDKAKAAQKASMRCQAWGYKKAEPFDAGVETCLRPGTGPFGRCGGHRFTMTFQCL